MLGKGWSCTMYDVWFDFVSIHLIVIVLCDLCLSEISLNL